MTMRKILGKEQIINKKMLLDDTIFYLEKYTACQQMAVPNKMNTLQKRFFKF